MTNGDSQGDEEGDSEVVKVLIEERHGGFVVSVGDRSGKRTGSFVEALSFASRVTRFETGPIDLKIIT